MKKRLTAVLMLSLLTSVPAPAQRAKRPTKPKEEEPGPVSVTRSATMRINIASDTVGIFDYLSDQKKLGEWFPEQAIMEPQLGGKYHFRFKDTVGVWSGVVTEFIRGNTLGFTWHPPTETAETNVHFKLSPQGAETVIELTHSGFTTSESLDESVKAWVYYLKNLKSVIEDGTDLRQQPLQPARKPPPRPRRSQGAN